MKTWTDQLNQNGILCIELATESENKMRELDPLEIYPEELTEIIEKNFGFSNNNFQEIKRESRPSSSLGVFIR